MKLKTKHVSAQPNEPLRNTQHEAFCQALVGQAEKRNLTDAYRRAYPRVTRKSAAAAATRLLGNVGIRARIAWLISPDRNPKILSVERRKEILSRIAAEVGDADPADYMMAGKDGVWILFGPESPNRKAVAGMKSRTDENDAVITEIKLHSPDVARAAIQTLNDMEGVGKPEKFLIPGAGGATDIEWNVTVTIRPRISNGADGSSNINPDQSSRKA